ncbi:MAG: nucleotidyltransferase family protein [Paludibacter sp.]
MKAMIFAAGMGTRLKPLTDTMPKALVPVAGKPLLAHVIEKLKAAGFDEILINVHHFPDQIISFVHNNNLFGIRIAFSDERDLLLETGGGIRHAASFFDDGQPFLVHNVDILSTLNIAELMQQHRRTNPLATLVVSKRDTFRYLLFSDDQRLQGWINEKTGETRPDELTHADRYNKYAFSGIQVLSPGVFELMQHYPQKFPIMDFYLQNCRTQNILSFVPENYRMIDVGKLNVLDEANSFFNPE